MFYYKKDNNLYYIWSDNIKGQFGGFYGIFYKNKYIGKYIEKKDLENKYPGYKYSFGYTKNNVFIISKNGIENIINLI